MIEFSSVIAVLCSFIMLILFPDTAADSVYSGLKTCAETIIPSLFPFFIISNLIGELGTMKRLPGKFSASAFMIGICGGYPIGAGFISDAVRRGDLKDEEAEKIVVYCNNSGPAFIIGAVGTGVFHSSAAGLLLYAVHVISALIYGKLFCQTNTVSKQRNKSDKADIRFSDAFTQSVKKSAAAIMNVCGFVLAFSVLINMINVSGLISILAAKLSVLTNTELHFSSALINGLFELGNAVYQMRSLKTSPINLALAAFILGWGGLSVHFQTFAVTADMNIKAVRYMTGRLIIAIIAAALSFAASTVFKIG